MNDPDNTALLTAFESHAVADIKSILDAGFDIARPIQGKAPISWLIEMYTRSDRFAPCLRVLLDHGATLDEPALEAVLLNDPSAIEAALRADACALTRSVTLVCAFTPLDGATLLHVAAEYGHLDAARQLIDLGADVDARAATDEAGMNGHTPLFHTVNSNGNRSAPVMELLLAAGARVDIQLAGITWGRGFDWETPCLDVTPLSYAQLGLLPQMHRREHDVYANVRRLLQAAGRIVPPLGNVPNRYLSAGS